MHDTLESLYKSIGMEALPDEYLPDDYTGPSAGPLKQIIRTYIYSHRVLTSFITHSLLLQADLKKNFRPRSKDSRG